MWYTSAVIVVLALCLHQGEAVKCYQCSSATDPKCGDPMDTSLATAECTPNVFKEGTALLKDAADAVSGLLGKMGIDTNLQVPDADAAFACVKMVRQDNDKKVVVRSCSIPSNDKFDLCKQVKAQAGPNNVVTFCESCDSDGCNAASGVVPSSLLLLLVAAVAAFLAKQ